MGDRSKLEHIFIIVAICVGVFAALCLAGCGGGCFGLEWGCESEDGFGCVSGASYLSEGCVSDDSCAGTLSCVDMGDVSPDAGDVLLWSCDGSEDGCGSETGSYCGAYASTCAGCGNCGSCGVFCGENDDYDAEDCTAGCVNGCAICGDTDGHWRWILEDIYDLLDIKEK